MRRPHAPPGSTPAREHPRRADAAHQRHRPVQFPLRLLHARGRRRAGCRRRTSSVRGDRATSSAPPIEVHGIRRFKLTGGEPTHPPRHRRPGRDAPRGSTAIEDLSLTTNGMLLDDLAGPLREAGLDRVTVSIDSLRPGSVPSDHAHGRPRHRPARASTAARTVGLRVTEDQLRDDARHERRRVRRFARLTLDRPLTVRFIEYMPLGDAALMHTVHHGERRSDVDANPTSSAPPADAGRRTAGRTRSSPKPKSASDRSSELGPLRAGGSRRPKPASARRTSIGSRGNPAGRIGFISAMSAAVLLDVQPPAAHRRRRAPLLPVRRRRGGRPRSILRSTPTSADARPHWPQAMTDCVRLKPDVHSGHGNRQMSRIGG